MPDKPQSTETSWLTRSEAWATHAAQEAWTNPIKALTKPAIYATVAVAETALAVQKQELKVMTTIAVDAAKVAVAIKPIAHAALMVAEGAAREVIDHPGKVAAEVAIGAGVVLASEALGVGAVAGAAIVAVPLAAYGIYKGVQMARKEGIGAIPHHLAESFKETKDNVVNTIATELHPLSHTAAQRAEADANLKALGASSTHFATGAVGGAAAGIETGAIEGFGNEFLASMEHWGTGGLRPAYAYAFAYNADLLPRYSEPGMENFMRSLASSSVAAESNTLMSSLGSNSGGGDRSVDTKPTDDSPTQKSAVRTIPLLKLEDGELSQVEETVPDHPYWQAISKVYEENRDSVVQIVWRDSAGDATYGSGRLIELEGGQTGVATANHVIRDLPRDTSVFVRSRGSTSWDHIGWVAAKDPESDLAILHITHYERSALPLAGAKGSDTVKIASHMPAPGEPLISFGYPKKELAVGLGQVVRISRASNPYRTIDTIQGHIFCLPGMSGGPVYDLEGGVVGVNSFKSGKSLMPGTINDVSVFDLLHISQVEHLFPLLDHANANIAATPVRDLTEHGWINY
jgi:S1-C subfamily serine protease